MSDEPLYRVTRGAPTPEELAAIVGVLWARRSSAAASSDAPAPARSQWRASAAPRPGRLPSPGPGAWLRAK
ncbi:MAG TPA: acyl-CoA carboxylase subunit epsilon [Micromonosporaceae bacterium]